MKPLVAIVLCILLTGCAPEGVPVRVKPACIIPIPLLQVGGQAEPSTDLPRNPCWPPEVHSVIWELAKDHDWKKR